MYVPSSRVVAALTLCGLTAAPASASFDVFLDISFELNSPDNTYSILPFIDVTGFTDDFDANNDWELTSPNGQSFGGPNSIGSFNFATLTDAVNEAESGVWSLEITDGVTNDFRTFELDISVSPDLDGDYFRPITLDSPAGLTDGSDIPQSPNFEWTLAPAADPTAEYDSLFGSIQGDAFVFDNLIPEVDDSWTPSIAPLAEGSEVNFFLFYVNSGNVPQNLIDISFPEATDGLDELNFFDGVLSTRSRYTARNLNVVPSPGGVALAALGGLAATRRRRG